MVTTESVAPGALYSVKLIVPVGLVPRVRCATSFTDPPAATEPLAVVVSAGVALPTAIGSSVSLESAVKLLVSPSQVALHLQVSGFARTSGAEGEGVVPCPVTGAF